MVRNWLNKKGSLNLSVEAIVVVVIAFVVLGLGLGFVKGQFEQIGDTSSAVQEQISQQILDDLRRSNNKLSFPSNDLTYDTKEEDVQAVGIKNTGDQSRLFQLKFLVKNGKDGVWRSFDWDTINPGDPIEIVLSDETKVSASILWDNTWQPLGAGDTKVLAFSLIAPTIKNTYLYKVELWAADSNADGTVNEATKELYDSKTFFVKTI